MAGFNDVNKNDWFADAVQYVVDAGLVNGTSVRHLVPIGIPHAL